MNECCYIKRIPCSGCPYRNRPDPGLGDDIACSKCGAVALDTGLECTECGHDMHPEIYPEQHKPGAMPEPGTEQ